MCAQRAQNHNLKSANRCRIRTLDTRSLTVTTGTGGTFPRLLCREPEGFAQALAPLIESLPWTTAISSAVRPYRSYTSRSISASVASI